MAEAERTSMVTLAQGWRERGMSREAIRRALGLPPRLQPWEVGTVPLETPRQAVVVPPPDAVTLARLDMREQAIYRALHEAAEEGRRCPGDTTLCCAEVSEPDQVSRVMRRLRAKGAIQVVSSGSAGRQVRIVATGRETVPPGGDSCERGSARRRCLGCGRNFWSWGIGNRVCDWCLRTDAFASPSGMEESAQIGRRSARA